MNRALNDPAMVKKLDELGGTPLKGSAEDFGKVVQSEVDKWAKVVKASGATVE